MYLMEPTDREIGPRLKPENHVTDALIKRHLFTAFNRDALVEQVRDPTQRLVCGQLVHGPSMAQSRCALIGMCVRWPATQVRWPAI